jgi:hypothetical protein
MRRRPTFKGRTNLKTIVRQLPRGNPDQRWFEDYSGREYRIRPKRHDEPGEGFLILKKLTFGCRQFVSIGPEGAMLADNDETLSKVFGILRGGKAGVIFPHDGTVVGEDELES